MTKESKSITIDSEINAELKKEAKKQRRSFSGMIEYICNEYIVNLKNKL